MSAPPQKPRPPLPPGPFLIVGLARSGQAVAQMLADGRQIVRGCDSGSPAGARRLAESGVEVVLDTDGVELLDGVKTVIKSPGVPQEAPVVAAARGRGTSVLGELEVAWRAIPNRFIGVTGTNGKTTTTELLGHIYRTAAVPVAVAGNVGTPLASLAGDLEPEATVVCECSSFQLEDSEAFAPECAVFLNISPDHLDRHGTLEQYLEAKLRIFANQSNDDVAVYDRGEPALKGRDLGGCARRIAFCETQPADPDCEVWSDGEAIFAGDDVLVGPGELRLIGAHNRQNAMAAAAAALAMGLERGAVAEGLRSFAGVPHRLEPVAEIDGVTYVNDSKATNVASAAVALRSFAGGVHVILGGSLKGGGFAELAPLVAERCAGCYLIGEAAAALETALAPAAGHVPIHRLDGLDDAVTVAAAAAQPGDVVLLSPACASFDAFRDFEQRGERFREIVEGLR